MKDGLELLKTNVDHYTSKFVMNLASVVFQTKTCMRLVCADIILELTKRLYTNGLNEILDTLKNSLDLILYVPVILMFIGMSTVMDNESIKDRYHFFLGGGLVGIIYSIHRIIQILSAKFHFDLMNILHYLLIISILIFSASIAHYSVSMIKSIRKDEIE